MKKILLSIVIVSLFSCQNHTDKENKFLRETLIEQKQQIEDLQKENLELKAKLVDENTSNDDIQHIGRWLDNRPGANIQLKLDKNLKTGKYYLKFKFDDGSLDEKRVRVIKENGLMKIQQINSEHVEWYIIEKNGDLSMWSQNGKYGTALCF